MTGTTALERSLLLAGMLLSLPALAYLTVRIREGAARLTLRRIAGMDLLGRVVGHALEEGRGIHISVGTGKLAEATTTETMAGLTTLDVLAARSIATGVEPLVTVPGPVLLSLAQDLLGEPSTDGAERQRSWASMYRARFIGPGSAAYAVGAMDALQHNDLSNSVTIGHFAEEFLLFGEPAAQKGLTQVAGTANPQGLPYMELTADQTLVGEEVFATGAYLGKWPDHLASLLIQDGVRLLIAAVILGGVLIKTVLG
jgi:hypothetical protein